MKKRVIYYDEKWNEWPGWFDEAEATLVYEEELLRVWLTGAGKLSHYAIKCDSHQRHFRIPDHELAILLMKEPEHATEVGKAWLEEQALEIL